ncbi:MAG TPA: hypothetical protein VMT18_12390 [Planctomycetota bacterium]|nr:hypothetical protein [Planctomycetota bacterium]
MDEHDPVARESALRRIDAPAIGMAVGAGLGALMSLIGIGWYALTLLGVPLVRGADERAIVFIGSIWGAAWSAVWVVLCGFVVWASLGLRNLSSYPLGLAAAVLSVFPCMMPCCPVSIPFGIWALVVMHGRGVRPHFRS